MKTFDTPQPIEVRLELGVGHVRITAADRPSTVVSVQPSDPAKQGDVSAAEQTRVDFSGGRLVIKGPRGLRQWAPWRGRESVDVDIELPEGSRLGGETGVVDLHATGRLGDVDFTTGIGQVDMDRAGAFRVRSGVGDIGAAEVSGPVDARTGTGRIDIGRADASVVVKNSNGDTSIGDASGELRVQSANGAISVGRSRSSVVAKSAMGNIRIDTVTAGSVVAQTGYGQIDVGILAGVPAWLDLQTGLGQVRRELDGSAEPSPGENTAEVRASTGMGNITIRRSAGVPA